MPDAAGFIASHRSTLASFAQAAVSAPLVTFDVFDTLIVRFFGEPADLFAAIGERIAAENRPLGAAFARERISAERRAREAARQRGASETSLGEIYDLLSDALAPTGATHDEIAALKEREIALEIACVRPDPQVVSVFDELVARGVPVVLVSDMYLPQSCVAEMLARCGVRGFAGLYVSSDICLSKADGTVWARVRADFGLRPDAPIAHLGDNPETDGAVARRHGVRPFLLCPPADRNIPSRYVRREHWLDDCFASLLRQDLVRYRDDPSISPYWLAIGHLVVAPAALGMAAFIRTVADRQATDRIFFLARDGLIFQKAYDAAWRRPDERPTQYLWCSRRAVNLAMIEQIDRQALDFLTSGTVPLSPREYAARIDVDPDEAAVHEVIARHFDDPHAPVRTDAQREALRGMLLELAPQIRARAELERGGLLAHLDGAGLFEADGIVVDLGWHGSMQRSFMVLGQMLTGRLPGLRGAYLGTFSRRVRKVGDTPMQAEGWLFRDGTPQDVIATFAQSIEIVELLFSAPEPGIRCVRMADDQPAPVRIEEAEEAPRLALAALFHDIVARDAAALRPVLDIGHLATFESLVLANLRTLLMDPTHADVEAFGPITHAQGFGVADYHPIVPVVNETKHPKALLDALNRSYWPRGFLRTLDPRTRLMLMLLAKLQTRVRRTRGALSRLRRSRTRTAPALAAHSGNAA